MTTLPGTVPLRPLAGPVRFLLAHADLVLGEEPQPPHELDRLTPPQAQPQDLERQRGQPRLRERPDEPPDPQREGVVRLQVLPGAVLARVLLQVLLLVLRLAARTVLIGGLDPGGTPCRQARVGSTSAGSPTVCRSPLMFVSSARARIP